MKKRNVWRRSFSLVLALAFLLSLPLTAFAQEATGTVNVETTAGNSEAVDVTITIESAPVEGGTNVQTTTVANGDVTESGMTVDYQGASDMTTDAGGNTTGTATTSYTAENADSTYGAQGGSELELEKVAPEVTVDVPLTESCSETVTGEAVGTSTTTGDTDTSDGTYGYTTEAIVQQGQVTVTTTELTTEVLGEEETEYDYETDLDYVRTEATPDEDNDLFIETASRVDVEAAEQSPAEAAEGYGYVYLGSENSSEYFAAYLFTAPQYEGEEPLYTIDGVDYYIGRADITAEKVRTFEETGKGIHAGFVLDGLYIDGQKVSEEQYVMVWGAVQQFLLQNSQTGELTTTYCVDQRTFAHDGFSYNIENIEDADYYDDEAAAHIRTIAENGYWGTEEGTGSLEAMRKMMRNATDENGNALFTEEEIALLNDGVAMTATQYAIWSYSNDGDNVKYLNVNYINSGDDLSEKVLSFSKMGDVPAEKQPAVDLIFKLSNYLINMDPAVIEDPSTANTVITAENAVQELSVSVIEKAENHTNNLDADDTNDAYVTDLSFALVVTPSTANGDDMIVKIVSNGQIIKEARIAGNAKEGETLETLVCDENGNYTISGITLIEGNQEFNITLEGIQNLEQGVYLYSSEIKEVDGEETSSQTMLGLADGAHTVNVAMTISFDLDVDDEIVATEHIWREEWTNPPAEEPPIQLFNIVPEFDDTELEAEIEILDGQVPLADVPQTGDASVILAALSAFSAIGLAGLQLTKKREDI